MKNGLIWRLDRSGHILGSPIQGIGGATDHVLNGTDQFFGPFDPVVSPDGTQIAYWDTVSEQLIDYNCGCLKEELVNITTTTAADRFTSPGFISHAEMPHWIYGTNRVTVSDSGQEPQAMTWVTGTDQTGEQWWFSDGTYVIQDIALSPDGSKVAAMGTNNGIVAPYDTVRVWTTNGPAFTGQPPYDNTAPGAQMPPAPTVVCNNHHGGEQLAHPSWSPDSSAFAFQGPEGIWINQLDPGIVDCSGLHEQLLVPGGQQPSWGPADVNMAQAPGTTGGGSPGGGSAGGGNPGAGQPGPRPGKVHLRIARHRVPARVLHGSGVALDISVPGRGRITIASYAGHRYLGHRVLFAADPMHRRIWLRLPSVHLGTTVRIVVSQNGSSATVTFLVV
jgi:hypothetical protein